MGLIDLFDRWITERGSAAIQEKHLAMFRDQLLAADKKIASLTEEIATLTAENSALKTENINSEKKRLELNATIDNLTKDNDGLKSTIHKLNNPAHDNLLDENKIKILQCLWNHPQGLTEDKIAHMLSFDIQTAKYHIEALEKNKMIDAPLRLPRPWTLLQGGREYLIENKLISQS